MSDESLWSDGSIEEWIALFARDGVINANDVRGGMRLIRNDMRQQVERLQAELDAAKAKGWQPVEDGEHEADGLGEAYFVEGAQLTVIEPCLYAEGNHVATIDLTDDVRLCELRAASAPEQPLAKPEQPITQEALKAAGIEDSSIVPDSWYIDHAATDNGIWIELDTQRVMATDGDDRVMAYGVKTMRDLSDLHRLLTGAPLPGEG